MLVAYRLAGLSALERHYAGLNARTQFGATQRPSNRPMRQGGQGLCRTNADLSQNGCRCMLGGMGTGSNFPVQARLGITHRPSSPSRKLRPTLA
jgi:hypothetical protein